MKTKLRASDNALSQFGLHSTLYHADSLHSSRCFETSGKNSDLNCCLKPSFVGGLAIASLSLPSARSRQAGGWFGRAEQGRGGHPPARLQPNQAQANWGKPCAKCCWASVGRAPDVPLPGTRARLEIRSPPLQLPLRHDSCSTFDCGQWSFQNGPIGQSRDTAA